MKKKILFLIPNLKHGGAEKVLVNLANNLDQQKYQLTVQTVFDIGVHRQSLGSGIRYIPGWKHEFRGYSHVLKLLPPRMLYRWLVKEQYDIVISYLEGVTARIVSGCTNPHTQRICWVHTEFSTPKAGAVAFRSIHEARQGYGRFHRIVAVSDQVRRGFLENVVHTVPVEVLYNTNETEKILSLSLEDPPTDVFRPGITHVCAIGRLLPVKGFDRLLNVHRRLMAEGLDHRILILGTGEDQAKLLHAAQQYGLEDSFRLLGFSDNPYKYLSQCDLFVCSSRREGFSTAVTEALVVGTAVVSTDCSGARELLGDHDEYGIVTENSEEGIYQGMKRMLSDPALLVHYKQKAKERGSFFSRTETVRAVEEMLDNI